MNKRLFVAGLPFSATDAELRDLFSKIGTVVSAVVIIDKFSGRSKGFGFVEMTTEEEAEKAIKELNESDFGGRKLIVNEARPLEERRPPSGGYNDRRGGGFRGGRDSDRRGGFGGGRGGDRGGYGRDR